MGPWSKTENEILKRTYPTWGSRLTAKALAGSGFPRTACAVGVQAAKLGVRYLGNRGPGPTTDRYLDIAGIDSLLSIIHGLASCLHESARELDRVAERTDEALSRVRELFVQRAQDEDAA